MPTLAELMAESQGGAAVATAPRGTSLADLAQESAAAPDTYHRDRLKAFLADPDAKRYGYDASMLDDLQRNAQAEAEAELQAKDQAAGQPSEAQWRAAHPPAAAPAGTPTVGGDQRGIWQQGKDLAQAGAMGARTGVYQGLSAIDTGLNLAHLLPDETAQRMHDLKRESERASDLGGAQGGAAATAGVLAGLPAQMDPITAPLVAGGQTGEDILAATGDDLLSAGDRTKATLAGIGAAAPAALAGKLGGLVAGPGEGIWNQAAHAITSAGAYSVPGAVATGAVAGDDPRLQELAREQIQGLPQAAGIMVGAGMAAPLAGALRGARPPMSLEQHAAAQPEYQRLEALWAPHEGADPRQRIDPTAAGLSPADEAALRAQSPDQVGAIKRPEPDDAPIPHDPMADFSPEEMRAMAIRNGEGGQTLNVPQGTAANQAAAFIRGVPRDLLEVPVNRRGDTLADALRQLDVHQDPDGALGNAQMLVQAAQRAAPAWRQGEQARSRQQVLADEEQGGGAQGGTDLASLAREVAPPPRAVGRTYEREQQDEHIQQPGRETDPNLRQVREQESSRTQADLSRVEEAQAQADQVRTGNEAERRRRGEQEAQLSSETRTELPAVPEHPEPLGAPLRPVARRAFREQLAGGAQGAELRQHLQGLLEHLGSVETVLHRNPTGAEVRDQAGQQRIAGDIGPGHHQARLNPSPFVVKFVREHGRSSLPSLVGAIRRAAAGKSVSDQTKGGKFLLDHGLDAIADGRTPDEAPDGLKLLREMGIPERVGQAPREGKPVETGSFPPIGPISDEVRKTLPHQAEPTPLDRVRADEEAGAQAEPATAPPRDVPPAAAVRHEGIPDQLERVRSEEAESEGGAQAGEQRQETAAAPRAAAPAAASAKPAPARPAAAASAAAARSAPSTAKPGPSGDVVRRPGADGAPVVVDRTRQVPLAAGISTDGKRVYIDPEMPRTVTTKAGQVVDVDKYLTIHETAEKPGMDAQGKPYPAAHDENAVPAENAALRADGIDPAEFNALLKPSIDAIAARAKEQAGKNVAQNLPPDLHPKHIEASQRGGMVSETKMVPNSRPDLALRSENPAEREALKLHDATRQVPEGVSVDQNIRSAHEALEKDFHGEAAKLEQHLVAGGAANAVQIEMARLVRDRLFREKQQFPSPQNLAAWTKWAELDRLAGSTWGSAGRQMRDRMQSPAERFAEANSVARITPTKLARKIQERAQALAKDKAAAATAAAAAKAHRDAVESLAKSAAPKPRPESGTAADRLKVRQKELADEFDRLAKKAKSFLTFSSNKPTGSNRFFELGYELLSNRIRAGFTKFARAALNIAGRIREYRFNDEAKRALEEAYDRHADENGDVEGRTQSMDEVLLADRIKREAKVLESREKNIAAKFEATKGMSDEQLREYLNREDSQGRLHPAIAKLRADFKQRTEAMTKAMKERADRVQAPEREAEKARRAAQREKERIAGEPQRILDAERALVEKHAKLQNMTDDQVRAWYESNKAKIPPEIQRLREASKERTAAVRAEIAKRRREVFKAEREAKVLAKRVAKREQEIADLKAKDQKRYERIKRRLKGYGFDLDDASAPWTKSKAGYAQFLEAQRAAGAGIGAMLNEHFIAALHASLGIPGVKVGSDVAQAVLENAPLVGGRWLRAYYHSAENMVKGKSMAAPLRGVLHAYGAILPGLWEGTINAAKSFYHERTFFPNQAMNEQAHYPVVVGKWHYGRAMRLLSGLTFVRAADSFAKSVFARMELADHAYRTALDEHGKMLAGDALTKHLQSEMTDHESRSWAAAVDHANRMTFTEIPIWPVTAINELKYKDQPTLSGKVGKVAANALFPFTVIPTNIATQAATRFVPGLADFLTIAKALHKDPATGEYGIKHTASRDFADAVTRWAAVAMVSQLNQDGTLTGRLDPKFPHSIHLMGHHFNYERLGSVGKGLSVLVDAVEGARKGQAITNTTESLWEAGKEEALLRPIMDMVKARDAEQRYGDGWSAYLAQKTPVPPAFGQIRNASNDTVEDHYAGTKNLTPSEAYLHFLKDRVGLPWVPPPRFKDGQPMPKDSFRDWPIGTWLWRAFSPAQMEDERQPKKPAKGHP